ncbi:DUF2721 domain-containing protein [Sinimarinibacterium flocculans]|uniref:Uncharacterized protein DUF2721 n=1 Tax=Sinimarinibacterium flocculans TaxID=985250 RepID=A0A318E4Y7_9GAMM|nr:DUF2721 domain-containing protein [Sinimarinibacterium flocculans]PXV66245.1 uncharacterized protein DUF2721 [Sinimarinibacterium flocculans]
MANLFGGGDVSTVAHAIQLAVAPAFLLTGVGATLNVMAHRLARVVDRARALEQRMDSVRGAEREQLLRQLSTLARRAKLIGRAITLCTFAALSVASVIIVLFLGAVTPVRVSVPVALLFILAMLALISALLLFLREVFLATRSLRIGGRET